MLAFWAFLSLVVFLDLLYWLLESIPAENKRLWPVTDEELRDCVLSDLPRLGEAQRERAWQPHSGQVYRYTPPYFAGSGIVGKAEPIRYESPTLKAHNKVPRPLGRPPE